MFGSKVCRCSGVPDVFVHLIHQILPGMDLQFAPEARSWMVVVEILPALRVAKFIMFI